MNYKMPIEAIKGFNKDMTCRGFQFEIGKTYEHDGKVVRCTKEGFHAVEMPLDVFCYYPLSTSVYASVEMHGTIDRAEKEDTKIAAAKITIRAEIKLPEIIKRAVDWIVNSAKGNIGQGDCGHAAATGDSGHAAATGYIGHAAATGDSGHAAATGDRGHAAATGYRGHAAATGYNGHAAATGKHAIAASLGINATAMAAKDGWIVLAAWAQDANGDWALVTVKTAKVGGPEGIKAGVAYRLTPAGEIAEVQQQEQKA
jgi:hypothetical protein